MANRLIRISSTVRNNARLVKSGCKWQSTSANAFKKKLDNMPGTQVSQHESGLRVASEDNGSPTATVGIYIDAGSRHESDCNNGVAHFLGHMALMGTQTCSQTELETQIENMGARLHAYTSRERTVFYIKCLSEDVPNAVEILYDIVRAPKLDEADIERVREMTLREMREVERNGKDLVFDHLNSMAYQGTALGKTIFGPSHVVKNIKQADLKKFKEKYYTPNRMVLAAAGGTNHGDLVCSADLFCETEPTCDETDPSCRFTGSEIKVRDDSMPLAYVVMAMETCGWSHADNVTLRVANALLSSWDPTRGGSKNSGIPLIVDCEDMRVKGFQSFNKWYKDTGLWGVYFVCEPSQCEYMVYNIQYQWMRLSMAATTYEVERGKSMLKSDVLLQLRGTEAVCEDIGRQMLYGNYRMSPREVLCSIDNVTVSDVKNVVHKYVYDRCPVVAAVGPVEGLPDYALIRGAMYWLRV